MVVTFIENSVLFKLEIDDNFDDFKCQISSSKYFNLHFIIDLRSLKINKFNEFIDLLFYLSKKQKLQNKSFVVISSNNDEKLNKLVLLPTLEEALDFIQLEEIERDLNII